MNIFNYSDAAKILKLWIGEKKKEDSSYNFTWLAEGLGVQKAFISQVLTDKASLSVDQAFQIAEFLKFKPEEKDYFLLLVERARTGLALRKSELSLKIQDMQRRFGGSKKSVQADFIDSTKSDEDLRTYFLDPYHSIVHVFLTLPEFQAQPLRLGERLGLDKTRLESILNVLQRLGAIQYDSKKRSVKMLKEKLHAPDRSQLVVIQQLLLRSLSLDRMQRLPADRRYNFNVTYSADAKSFQEIQKEFHIFVEKVGEIVRSAPPQIVYQLNFDLFPWS